VVGHAAARGLNLDKKSIVFFFRSFREYKIIIFG